MSEFHGDIERLERIYPRWEFGRERHAWTATRRPTATSLWFIYAFRLDQLERKLREAETQLTARQSPAARS